MCLARGAARLPVLVHPEAVLPRKVGKVPVLRAAGALVDPVGARPAADFPAPEALRVDAAVSAAHAAGKPARSST
jgi:hypothetical protein